MTRHVLREEKVEKIEVHVAGVCIDLDSNGRVMILVARRLETRELYPGLIEGCGGQLRPDESFVDGLKRHFRDEMDLDVGVIPQYVSFYEILREGEPLIPGIKMLCILKDGVAKSPNHDWVKLVSREDFEGMPSCSFIPGLKEQTLFLIDQWERNVYCDCQG